MKKHEYVGHVSPEFGSVRQRTIDAGLEKYRVRENVALDMNMKNAMNNLLKSPVHRGAIFDPQITHLGVGIVFDDSSGSRHYYVTQEFANLE